VYLNDLLFLLKRIFRLFYITGLGIFEGLTKILNYWDLFNYAGVRRLGIDGV
tara:strand:- start:7112 stop:7267 length:156 start_codon:yes stop_codon:yes gene_type:complete